MAKVFKYDSIPPVQTTAGKIRGYFFDRTYIFKGIPYAQAERFQMSTPPTPWEGERECASYGFVSPMLKEDQPTGELFVPHRYWIKNENCQNLNVWTKSLDREAKRPVMVWFHGGAFSAGSAIEHIAYDGANMCDKGDLVIVSVNHRLNILGYLDLSHFGEKYKNSANVGHADMVASLEWVRDNIANFGGDPGNVTIFGQSGGGMKCTGLMQIPAADGLFHKAILMSGVSDGSLLRVGDGDGRQIADALMTELGFDNPEQLETVPYYELAQAYNKVAPQLAEEGIYVGNRPKANYYNMGEPLESGAGFTEHAKTIPFLVGTVFGEFAFGPLPLDKEKATEAEVLAEMEKRYGSRYNELAHEYKKAFPDKKLVDIFALDTRFRIPSKKLAALAAEEGMTAYLYQFNLEFPYRGQKIAWHCADIPFFFNNTEMVEVCNIEGVTEKLEAQMYGAFKTFAETGDPNHAGIPTWPKMQPNEEPTFIFDRECEVLTNFDGKLMELLTELAPPMFITPAKKKEDRIQH